MTPEERLRELGHTLPPAPKSVANYVGSVHTGNLLFLSGKGPDLAGGRTWQGKLGVEFTTPTTKEDWATYAMFKDPDGNEFYIIEE